MMFIFCPYALLLEDYALVWCSGNSFYYCTIRYFGHGLIELAQLFIFLFLNSNVGIFCYLFRLFVYP